MLRHLPLAAAIVGVAGIGVFEADCQRAIAAPQNEKDSKQTRKIEFSSKYQAGQKFVLKGQASKSIAKHPAGDKQQGSSATIERDTSKNDDAKDSKNRSRKRWSGKAVWISGDLEILDVDSDGFPTKLKLTVERFKTSAQGNESKQVAKQNADQKKRQKAEIGKNTVVIATTGEDGPKFTIQKDDSVISGDLAEALNVILPICDKKKIKQGFADAFAGRQNRKPGESWDVDEDEVPKSHRDMGLVYTRATFVGQKELHGTNCHVVRFRCSAKPLKNSPTKSADEKATAQSGDAAPSKKKMLKAIGASAFVYVPIEKDLPPLRVGGSVAFLVKKKGKNAGAATETEASADNKKTSPGRIMQYSFFRDLKPQGSTAETN